MYNRHAQGRPEFLYTAPSPHEVPPDPRAHRRYVRTEQEKEDSRARKRHLKEAQVKLNALEGLSCEPALTKLGFPRPGLLCVSYIGPYRTARTALYTGRGKWCLDKEWWDFQGKRHRNTCKREWRESRSLEEFIAKFAPGAYDPTYDPPVWETQPERSLYEREVDAQEAERDYLLAHGYAVTVTQPSRGLERWEGRNTMAKAIRAQLGRTDRRHPKAPRTESHPEEQGEGEPDNPDKEGEGTGGAETEGEEHAGGDEPGGERQENRPQDGRGSDRAGGGLVGGRGRIDAAPNHPTPGVKADTARDDGAHELTKRVPATASAGAVATDVVGAAPSAAGAAAAPLADVPLLPDRVNGAASDGCTNAERGTESAHEAEDDDEGAPRGYIQIKSTVSRAQARLVHRGWLPPVNFNAVPTRCRATYPDAAARVLCHVLVCGSKRRYEGGFVPVSCRLLEHTFDVRRTEDIWRPLVEAGLLEWRPHYSAHLSREFRIPPALRDEYVAAGAADTERYNLFTNAKCRASPAPRPLKTDSEGRPIPPLIFEAKLRLWKNGCLFDRERAETHVAELRLAYDEALDVWNAEGRPVARRARTGELIEPMALAEQAMIAARGRWRHDRYCLDQMLRSEPEHVAGKVWRYRPRFKRDPQSGGRITEVGGLQSASGGLKQAALGHLQCFGVRNYDMRAAHPHALIQLFEDADVSTNWLRQYLASDKVECAERVFGSEEHAGLWKRLVLALMMNAKLPTHLDVNRVPRGDGSWVTLDRDIAAYIRDAFGGGRVTAAAEAALASFRDAVGEFEADRNAWHEYLVGPYVEEHASWGRGGRYIKNAAGLSFNIAAFSGWELKSKLAAFLLQGLESGFIHKLTVFGPQYGFRSLSNQYDGLVTEGEIPGAAVAEALEQSQLRYVELVEKLLV